MTHFTDIQLMLRTRDGDVAAFGELVRRWRDPLRRLFAAMLADPAQAEDCAQETLLRLWLLRERYQPAGSFSAYLFQIGRHYWLNQRKKLRLQPPTRPEEETFLVAAPALTQPESILLERLRGLRLRRAIDALPPRCRDIFTMSHFEGLTYAEIAGRLGIPVGTVKSRMAEAVRRLRAELTLDDERG